MDQFEDLLKSLSDNIRYTLDEMGKAPSLQDQVLAFVHAVDWTEPWIIGLLTFHALLLIIVLLTRKYSTLQYTIFLFGVSLVWGAESLNALGALHWKRFSQQNYFDQNGLFISTMLSGPIIVVCIIILVQYMATLIQYMVKWKKMELRHRARKAAAADKAAEPKKTE